MKREVLRRLEGHTVATVVTVAFLLRAALATLVRVVEDGILFEDDGSYIRTLSTFANQGREGLTSSQRGTWDALWGFFEPLGWLVRFASTDPLVPMLATALAGSLVAGLVSAMTRRRFSDRMALVAGLLVALMPSQILWSSLVLRDAFSWLALSSIALMIGTSSSKWRRGSAWFALPVVLYWLNGIRGHTFLVASIASALALLFTFRRRLQWIAALALVLLAVGVASGTIGRLTSVLDSGTAGRQEELTAAVDAGKTTIACVVIPFVYEAPSDGVGWSGDLKCFPSGARMMLFDPFPNQLGKSLSLLPAFFEHVFWYPLLYLAFRGVRRLRGWTTQDVFVLAAGLGTLCVWALVDRNFGTAYRHRGEFFWAVAYFSTIGLHDLVTKSTAPAHSLSARIRGRLVPDEPRCSPRSR